MVLNPWEVNGGRKSYTEDLVSTRAELKVDAREWEFSYQDVWTKEGSRSLHADGVEASPSLEPHRAPAHKQQTNKRRR